jgi:hypothetical protein
VETEPPFTIDIQQDAVISISSKCGGESSLDFEPGIANLDEDYATPTNAACANYNANGYWTVTNIGNIALKWNVKLNAT